jgi:hypothetical protein
MAHIICRAVVYGAFTGIQRSAYMEKLMDDSRFTAFPNGEKLPRVHVIGNGASNSLFDAVGEYRIACNIPQHSIPYNALAIIDLVAVNWMRDNGWNPTKPVLCTQQVKDHAVKRNREGHWFAEFNKVHRFSAGHHAVLHHASMTPEVHMWGFDSIWANDFLSQVDAVIPRPNRPNLNLHWIPHWRSVFKQHEDTLFFIHAPADAQLPELGHNARKA